MCTLTIIPDGKAVVLTMNRDEHRERKEGGFVAAHTASNIRYCYPLDQEGGGTWVGMSASGYAVALLNRYNAPSEKGKKSRGLLVKEALGLDNFDQALSMLSGLDTAQFNPFDCILLGKQGQIRVLSWDGEAFTVRAHAIGEPFMHTSSSWNFEQVRDYRLNQFQAWVQQHGRAEDVDLFHMHQDDAMKSSAVCMSRELTHSKSLIQIRFDLDSSRVVYFDEGAIKANMRISEFTPTAEMSFDGDAIDEHGETVRELRAVVS